MITYCIYRYNKSKSNRSSTDTSNSIDFKIYSSSQTYFRLDNQSHPPVATIIYNAQHGPYAFEELPPSYESLKDNKKDPSETIQLTILPNSNEQVAAEAAVIQPSAPVPPDYSEHN